MKKTYQKPVTEIHVIELHPLMDGQSIEVNSNQTQNNNDAFSRDGGGWDDDY